jgi:glycosyltransferase involved in cell wall biosynthesis
MMEKETMNSKSMISLVIPVYNEQGNLPALMERIRRVMSAMDRPYEVILVDDGSRDGSLEMLRGFAASP